MSKMMKATFGQGNDAPVNEGDPAPDFDFATFANRTDIVLIMTVDVNGLVTIFNHPRNPEKLANIDHYPKQNKLYPTGSLADTCVLNMAIYADKDDAKILRLGAWNPGPPKRCYT
jgi:hypothetical protein